MALLKDGTRIYGTLFANTEVVIGSMNVASRINASFLQANSANILAQAAFDKANTVSANTVYTQGVDSTQNTNITSVNSYAASAYSAANTAAANTVYLQVINDAQNTRITTVFDQANVGASFVGNGGTIAGNVTIQGSLSVNGNVTYTGNVTSVTVSGNTGQFFGYASNGFNALYAGVPTGYLVQPQTVFQVTSNYNGYAQLNQQNINPGNLSSADFIITADNGTMIDTFLDLGLASSSYSYPGYGLIKPNDGYWIVYGNTITGGGNAIIATGATNDIVFATNGVEDNRVIMRITSSNTVLIQSTETTSSKTTGALQVAGGVGIQGDVQATNVYSQGVNLLPYIQGVNNTQNTNVTSVNSYATSGYNQANTATTLAQAAFDKANTGSGSSGADQYARDTANTASANTIYTQGVDATQNASITFLNVYTQAAFDKANTGGGGGGSGADQYARDTANSKTYTFYQNTAPSTSNAHDLWVNSASGVVYENFGNTTTPIWAEFGPTPVSNTGNVVINTLDRLSNLSSILILNNDGSLTFNDNTLQTTAYTGFGIDNVARITANTANTLAQITSVRSQAAFDKANTAVSSTIGKAIAMAMVFGG